MIFVLNDVPRSFRHLHVHVNEIGHFRVAVNLTVKLVLFAFKCKLILITKTLHLASLS